MGKKHQKNPPADGPLGIVMQKTADPHAVPVVSKNLADGLFDAHTANLIAAMRADGANPEMIAENFHPARATAYKSMFLAALRMMTDLLGHRSGEEIRKILRQLKVDVKLSNDELIKEAKEGMEACSCKDCKGAAAGRIGPKSGEIRLTPAPPPPGE